MARPLHFDVVRAPFEQAQEAAVGLLASLVARVAVVGLLVSLVARVVAVGGLGDQYGVRG